ncbi:MAG: ABC transporter permease subunit [Chloroflexi bacterium]|nr:ABC transporter permease subunit [Chloroflexota bacterium]
MSQIPPPAREKTSSVKRSRRFSHITSYAILGITALVMILPLLWLINGSLQPEWQINANPVIWIPREWKFVYAGDTYRPLYKYLLKTSDNQQQEVIQIGTRRYTIVVDPASLHAFESVPRDQLSDAVPTQVNGLKLNVRDWKKPGGTEQVVAIARDPNDENKLLVIQASQLTGALSQYPLDVVNQGKSGTLTVSGADLQTRTMPDGKQVVPIGPEDELWVMGSPDVAAQAKKVLASKLGAKEFKTYGQTSLPVYAVNGEAADARFINMAQESWQPLVPQSIVAKYGFVAKESELSAEKTSKEFNGLNMNVRIYTPASGGSPAEVAILFPNPDGSLVMPTQYMNYLQAAPFTQLVEPGSVEIGVLTYRVKEDFKLPDGKYVPMAMVGDLQDVAIIVHDTALTTAYDSRLAELTRSTRIHLDFTGYIQMAALKLWGVPFWQFFLNSGYLVVMNFIGYFISCVLVAYGFARLRAPGKNVLFIILLGTMMVPYTIITLPTYLIFRDLGLLGTMLPLWIRSFFGNAFLIFILRQFFMGIPYELDEAAYLDGANRWQILMQVILPLSKPALATVGIFTFWWTWNSFFDPLVFTTKQKYYTITLAMTSFNRLYGAGTSGYYQRVLAGSVLTLLPMVVLFIVAQRYFIEGIQLQGLKR